MKNKFSVALIIVSFVIVFDQMTKNIIARYPMGLISRICSCFNIIHIKNTGAAFSFLAGSGDLIRLTFLIGLPVILTIALVIYMYKQRKNLFVFYSLSLILGGAIGNLIDRIKFGAVVDFLDFYFKSHHYPTFNVADSFVTIGVIFLLLNNLKASKSNKNKQ